MINIEHNSQELFYRSPFGAVKCSTEITFRLAVVNSGIPHYVRLMIMNDGCSARMISMVYVMSVAGASVYEASVEMPDTPGILWYYFEFKDDGGTFYYGNNNECLGGVGETCVQVPENKYQISVYSEDYSTPEWFRDAVAYQIFPDRFFNGCCGFLGDRTDIIKRSWGDMPFYKAEQFGGEYLANDFFGGNLEGIIKKLPYLSELGIGAVYLNPIFKAYSNHKYDTGDYEQIDPMFGDEETFKRLCSEAEKLGIKIILDGVFNHTGSDSKYFNKKGSYDSVGAYNSEKSEYYDWYTFTEYPNKYESWWGMLTLPGVNESSESYRDYILRGDNSIVKRWLKSGASGWRLDVADELPDFFIKELREAAKSVDKDAVIIGEVWEDATNKISYGKRREYFLGKELDSVMNYPLKNMLTDAALCRIDAAELDRRLMSIIENYPKPALYSLLNMLSSHDSERIMTMMGDVPQDKDGDFKAGFKLGEGREMAKRRLRTVVAAQLLLPGVPCIYYGDEIGMEGYADPFCRQTFDWNSTGNEIYNMYKTFIGIRKSSSAFSSGSYKTVYKIGNVFGFLRSDGDESYIVLLNFSSNYENIRLDVGAERINNITDIKTSYQYSSENGIYFLGIGANDAVVFKAE